MDITKDCFSRNTFPARDRKDSNRQHKAGFRLINIKGQG